MNKIKISVLGAGYLGKIHIKLLSQNDSANLIGIYDINREQAKQQAELYNTKCFAELDEAIEQSDALLVIVPTTEHYNLARKSLLSGKHIFIEKPVCSGVSEAKELIAISKEFPKLKIQIGHIERFNPVITAARKYDVQPKFIETHRLTQFRNRSTDVSVIHDLMIHDIDLAL
jgi:predicted dehydrogenase